MLERKMYDELLKWKNDGAKKCLLLGGQRQVGKTYLVEQFGINEYKHMVEVDLSKTPDIRNVFETSSTVDQILNGMKLYLDPEAFVPGSTLIFLDEIQVCPSARSALKMFTSDGRYDVIASGSLLGVRNPKKRKTEKPGPLVTPVGYVTPKTLRSLDFEEFLWARGFPRDSIEKAKKCIHERTGMPGPLYSRLCALFKEYLIVGGMPESVNEFVAAKEDYSASEAALNGILRTCLDDVDEYNIPVTAEKVKDCLRSIPNQLGKANKKFMYSHVPEDGSRGTGQKYEEAIGWLDDAGYTNLCYNLTDLSHPLPQSKSDDPFKAYLSDTGMLVNMMGINAVRAIYSRDLGYNMGAVIENAVAEGLRKSGIRPRYFERTSGERLEIDFVIESQNDLIAVEVKSGKTRRAPSLSKVSRIYTQVNRRVMLEDSNIYVDDNGIEHYPLFAACFAKELLPEWNGPEFMDVGFERAPNAIDPW